MNQNELRQLLNELIAGWENEVVEFKGGKLSDNFSNKDLYRYFSALSNEANLRQKERAWLVLGVHDKTRQIEGTQFHQNSSNLQKLKAATRDNTGATTFIDIHEFQGAEGRVVLFEIPPAPLGIPIFSDGVAYGRVGESTKPLDLAKLDEIRNQIPNTDWSAEVVERATIQHLDAHALEKARKDFAKRFPSIGIETANEWDDMTFLDKLQLTQDGKLTRAAILLFGKPEATLLLSPFPAQLTWKLVGEENAYEHFGLPFYLTTSALYSRIRNIQVSFLPEDSLIPVKVSKYDQEVVLEALHNCIMHQDYRQNSRIIVTEYIDRLELISVGDFFEGKPEDYITKSKTPRRYRNPCLAQAMVKLNMVDSLGQGISRIYKTQAQRFLPLPDYDTGNSEVMVTIYGKEVDPAYTQLLLKKTDLSLADILALDRVQKHQKISPEVAKRLRKHGLIEGRMPNLVISANVAKVTPASHVEYVRKKDFDIDYYEQKILGLLKVKEADRPAIDALLMDQFGEARTPESRKRKIGTVLSRLKNKGIISNKRQGSQSIWFLLKR